MSSLSKITDLGILLEIIATVCLLSDKCRSDIAGPLAPLALSPITSLTSLGAASGRAAFYYHDRRPPSGWMRQHICRQSWRRAQHAPVLKWNVPWWILGNVFSSTLNILEFMQVWNMTKIGKADRFCFKNMYAFCGNCQAGLPLIKCFIQTLLHSQLFQTSPKEPCFVNWLPLDLREREPAIEAQTVNSLFHILSLV